MQLRSLIEAVFGLAILVAMAASIQSAMSQTAGPPAATPAVPAAATPAAPAPAECPRGSGKMADVDKDLQDIFSGDDPVIIELNLRELNKALGAYIMSVSPNPLAPDVVACATYLDAYAGQLKAKAGNDPAQAGLQGQAQNAIDQIQALAGFARLTQGTPASSK